MGLRLKILSGFLVLALMLLIAGIWSVYQLKYIGSSVQRLLDDNYRSIEAAETMLQALERQDSGILVLLLGRWEEGRGIIEPADALFEEGYKIARNNVTIPGEEDYLKRIGMTYQSYKDKWERPIVGTNKEGDLDWYLTTMHSAFLDVQRSINELKSINESSLYETASHLKNRANRAAMPGIVAIIAALVFSLIFSYLVNVFMVGPMINMTRAIKSFIEKNVSFQIDISTNDEISELASAIKTLCSMALRAKSGE